jgi:ribulose-phosphate 3-epimerase
MLISQSLWSVDQGHIADEVQRYGPIVDSFHIDVMDGAFADALLYGPSMVDTIRPLTERPIVVHLMALDPVRWAHRFAEAGADQIVIHPSACRTFTADVDRIRNCGVGVGAAVGLSEPVEPVLACLDHLSAVLVMATPIGVKGQPFDAAALDTVTHISHARTGTSHPPLLVDGGIRWSSIARIAAAAADGVVTGSITASAADPVAAVRAIARLAPPIEV